MYMIFVTTETQERAIRVPATEVLLYDKWTHPIYTDRRFHYTTFSTDCLVEIFLVLGSLAKGLVIVPPAKTPSSLGSQPDKSLLLLCTDP